MWGITLPRKGPVTIKKPPSTNQKDKERQIANAEQDLMHEYQRFHEALTKFEAERDSFEECHVSINNEEMIENIRQSLYYYSSLLEDRDIISDRLLAEPIVSCEQDEIMVDSIVNDNITLQNEIEKFIENINTPDQTITEAERSDITIEDRKNDIKIKNSQLSTKINEVESEITAIKAEIQSLTDKVNELDSSLLDRTDESSTEIEKPNQTIPRSISDGSEQYFLEKQVFEANEEEIKLREQIIEDTKIENSQILSNLEKEVQKLRGQSNSASFSDSIDIDLNSLSKKLADKESELVQMRRLSDNQKRLLQSIDEDKISLEKRKEKINELKSKIELKKQMITTKKQRVLSLRSELNNFNKEPEIENNEEIPSTSSRRKSNTSFSDSIEALPGGIDNLIF
ncbi:hypothetical protein TVAG_042600 [Trichomonas vaginalis G3]|uniref:Uncharacterized protein n=1 Tax=Trichomonas vaginalis (strain ATCC PRA-98 / G3) TaxID=412133 RepID=A2G2Z1_TRIV3|nr:hypothetical protein TVAGG3_0943510 [Trichomonas vaginalis G3]EAX88475.1 hypothetical protein TVAG_042600 [Trichomonas vaginalis G3]KAI5486703.1 hypothetical protein TVAGG3_0943510 [Trichomonas vaginalis G3]|eukprot:XP_001301405.1 hypothetical protein [Trichomonas vaginalis G3]